MKLVDRETYTLRMHDSGTTLDQFLSISKPHLSAKTLLKISDPDVCKVTIKYVVQTPADDVLWDMAVKEYQREDGQWYYKGNLTPPEVILSRMREVVKILMVYIDVEKGLNF